MGNEAFNEIFEHVLLNYNDLKLNDEVSISKSKITENLKDFKNIPYADLIILEFHEYLKKFELQPLEWLTCNLMLTFKNTLTLKGYKIIKVDNK